ncbi:MAG: hypothetical protein R3B48_21235 [Kofleriaceae bacterium]
MTLKYLIRHTYLTALLLGLAASCQSGEPSRQPAPPPVDTGGPLAPGPEATVGQDYDLARVTFSTHGSGFRGGHETHQVDITNGLIEMTAVEPRHDGGARRSPTFGLQTAAAWRGEIALDATPMTSALSAPNVVETVRHGFRETVRNSPEGIEQSWHFDRAPDGEGDLLVAIEATGLDYAGATDGGLHFRRAGELGVRYSHGTWVEADGTRWAVQAQYENGRIVLAVPADIVAGSKYPAVLDPTVTAEVLSDVPVIGSSGVDNANGKIATDGGSGYFVVWQDRRNTRADDIWGARVDAGGNVLDDRGIKIYENSTTTETNPAVAWVGNGWLVAWESGGDISAAFVSTAAAVTQLGPVATTAAVDSAPALASRGGEALLTWMVGGADISGAIFSGGSFGEPFAIANTADPEKSPSVAADPAGEYLVAFQVGPANDNVRAQRVTSAGALSGAALDLTTEIGSQTSPSASFNGTDFVVVWTTSVGSVDLRGARIDTAGTLRDASPGVLITGSPEQQTFPNVACESTGACWVSWQDRRNLSTSSFDIFGTVLNADMTLGTEAMVTGASRAQTSTASAASGGQWMTVWTDLRDGEVRGMFGSRVSSDGTVMDASGVQLGKGYDRHSGPTVARAPTVWSVMWGATRGVDFDAVHVRYNANGGQLDSAPITISSAPGSQLPSGSIYAGSSLLTVWTDNRSGSSRDIYGARVNPVTGAALDAAGFPISTAAADQAGAKVATNGTTSLVVWQDRRNGNFDIYAALLNANGTVGVGDVQICGAAGDQVRPAVAYDTVTGVYLVAWADPTGGNGTDIRGARVSAAGALLDAGCGVTISGAAGSQLFPDVAFSGNQFLVTWEDRRSDPTGDIYSTRVNVFAGGITVVDPNGVPVSAVAGAEQTNATVAPYGGNFVVAWEDGRNLGTTKFDIYGARVLGATGVAETAFAIANSPDDERNPDISDGPAATSPAKVAYLRTRLDLDTVRVQVRRITYQTSTGASCSSNSQCSTGFCVDSRCCDTACGGTTISDCQACSVARGAAVDGVCSVIAGPNLVICRNYARIPGICDLREYCDGVNAACPPDLGINEGRVCNSTTGTVCPSNSAAGAPHICP